MQLAAQQSLELMDLARSVIRSALSREQVVIYVPADTVLHQPAGAFVSLHARQTHRLRGCVGRLDATQQMYQAVAHAAQSVLGDPRFGSDRVTLAELPNLTLEISLLAPLQPAKDADDFDLKNDGIYLTVDDRSGCFLPQVARETGWTREAASGSTQHGKTWAAGAGVDAAERKITEIRRGDDRAGAVCHLAAPVLDSAPHSVKVWPCDLIFSWRFCEGNR